MAFNSLTRLLWSRRRQVPKKTTTFISPPLFDLHLQFQNHLTLLGQANREDINRLLLGCLPGQGSYTLKIPELPIRLDTSTLKDLEEHVKGLPGFVRSTRQYHTSTFDFVVDFVTAAEASMALATLPTIDLGDGERRGFEYTDIERLEPSRKRIKMAGEIETDPIPPLPHCQVCSDEISGPFVRPCLYCRQTWCYDCIKSDFEACLKDVDRFPARCCGRLKHYDVARGIIPSQTYIEYKTRFEELSTTRPVYCANMRCSTFLPARICPPDERGFVCCFQCKTFTCKQCRVVLEDTEHHKCVASDEATVLLRQFEYKCCPRCNIAVARMYGCSHMRCRCGTHFCWDCLRAIQVCWQAPCAQARLDNGDYPDDVAAEEEEEELNSRAVQEPATQPIAGITALAINPNEMMTESQRDSMNEGSTTPLGTPPEALLQGGLQSAESTAILNQPGTHRVNDGGREQRPLLENTTLPPPTPAAELERPLAVLSDLYDAFHYVANPTHFETPPDAPPHTPVVEPVLPPVNLDFGYDWEGQDFDFGDEPTDEPWNTWGCLHKHTPVPASSCKEWVPVAHSDTTGRLERHIDCMRCLETIVFDEATEVQKRESNGDPKALTKPNEVVSEQLIGSRASKESKACKKTPASEMPKLFQCQKCGVFHCLDCKKLVAKDIAKAKGRHDRR